MEKNYAKFKEEGVNKDNDDKLKVMNAKLEEEPKKVRAKVAMLQDCKKHEEEMVVLRKQKLDKENEIMKEEKKKN
jgi:hypothetical protein